MPIVNEVKRKSYEKDNNGNVMKEITLSKDGTEKLVPKLKRDDEGKIIYENVKGKFLNNDQFWKDLGGKESYAILQNKFNAHMKENGFRLDRGNVGTHKIHQTKLDYQINESKAELNNLNNYINNSKKELNELITNLKNYQNNNEINVKKTLNVYNKKDVDKLIDYAYNLKKLNKLQEHTIKDKTQKYKKIGRAHV